MQNNGRYKRRLGNSCFSLKVRNTGIHKGRYIMQKTKQNTKELIPCLISHCAIAVKLATWLSTATLRTPNQLSSLLPDCSHHGLHPWDVAVLKAHDLKWTTLQEIKKKQCREVLVIRKPAENIPFSLEEVPCTWGIYIYQWPWQNISKEAPCSYFGSMRVFPLPPPPPPVANVAPSATKPVVPACPPSFQSAAEAWCVVLQWSPSILAQVKPIHCAPGAEHVGEPLCQDCGPPSWGTMEHTAHHIPSPCLGSAQLIFLFCSFFLFTIHCKKKKKGTRFLKLERYVQWKKTNSILKWLSQWWLVICAVSSTW